MQVSTRGGYPVIPGTRVKDLTGRRFGMWLVLALDRTEPMGRKNVAVFWSCRCDCGTERIVRGSDLKQSNTNGCGCRFGREKDLTGQRFGRLVVAGPSGQRTKLHRRSWRCRCDCGAEVSVITHYLTGGDTKSCGCWKRDEIGDRSRTHGRSRTAEYGVWCGMRERCTNPHSAGYPDYGQRGIKVCERWNSFEAFIEDMGPRPGKNYSLERLDNDGPYSPGNCLWISRAEQNLNKRSNKKLTFNGETLTIAEWARRLDLSATAIEARLAKGWSVERAVGTPRLRDCRGLKANRAVPEYVVWCSMRYRCHNPNDAGYKNYGGRGIQVCARWRESFSFFLEDMGSRPSPQHQLERIDNDGNYEPRNCRWATKREQANNRRSTVFLELDGKKQSLADWARDCGISRAAIRMRLRQGWTVRRALTTPRQ